MPSIGAGEIVGSGSDGKLHNYLRRYSAAENLGSYDNDELSDEISDDHINDQIGAQTAKILQPLRDQVGNMGIDVAVLDETLQTLMSQTEGANRRISQVTHFVVDLIERLEDIDEKARSLLDKWKEESRAISDFTEHADDMSERFSNNIRVQEQKMNQLSDLLNKLESETKRLSLIPSKGGSTKPEVTEEVVKNLLVEAPENVDFHSKRKAFFALAEKRKTNDTYQTFKAAVRDGDMYSSNASLEKVMSDQSLPSRIEQSVSPEPRSEPTPRVQPGPPTPPKSRDYILYAILVILLPILGCLVCIVSPELCHKLQEVISAAITIAKPTDNIPS